MASFSLLFVYLNFKFVDFAAKVLEIRLRPILDRIEKDRKQHFDFNGVVGRISPQ